MQIHDAMRPIVRRRRLGTGMTNAVRMLFVCCVVSACALLGSLMLGMPSLNWYAVIMLVGLPLGAFVAGFFRRHSIADAAIEADRCYGLQDRVLSAIEFERICNLQPIHELQLADARQCASQFDPRDVVPLTMTRHGWVVVMSAIVITMLAFVAGDPASGKAKVAVRSPAFTEESQQLADQAKKLDELAEQQEDTAIAEIAKKMNDSAQVLREESTELGDVLAEYSRLQEEMRGQRAEYDAEMMQSQLQAIAKALRGVAGLENMSQALEQLEFESAARDLESFDGAAIDPLLAEGTAAQLQEIAEQLNAAKLDSLSEAVEELGEGLAEADAEDTSAAAKDLAAQLRKLGKQSQADSVLQSQLAMLQESKAELVSGQSIDIPSPKPQQALSEVGSGIDGELDGEPSQLDTSRQQMELAGTLGEGASSVETSIAQADDAQAQRSYRDVYQEYEKQSRAVLEAEPIPLGHRQTIRRYFKLIRPVDEVEEQ